MKLRADWVLRKGDNDNEEDNDPPVGDPPQS